MNPSMSSEKALVHKKKVRAAHRTSTTTLMGQVDSLIKGTLRKSNELALLQTNLSAKLTTLEALNTEVVELILQNQLEEEIGRADEYAERIQRMLFRFARPLKPRPYCQAFL